MTEAELLLDLANGITRTMKKKNITPIQIYRKTGLSYKNLHRYKKGLGYPTARNMAKLLSALNVSLRELMEGEN